MVRIFITLNIFFLTSAFCQSPQWDWAFSLGNIQQQTTFTVELVPDGDVIFAGEFEGTVDFKPGQGSVNLTAPFLSEAAFITRFDSAGALKWAKMLGKLTITSLVADHIGNLYYSGIFSGTQDFNPDPANQFLMTCFSCTYILKTDTAGNFMWARSIPTGSVANGLDATKHGEMTLGAPGSGVVYLGGFFSGTVDFDPGPGISQLINTGGTTDMFIAQFDTSGNYKWAKAVIGTGGEIFTSLAPDSVGGIYAGGYFSGTADFDPDTGVTILSTGTTDSDCFLMRMDSVGTLLWAHSFGGSAGFDIIHSLTTDVLSTGDVFMAGSYESPADLDPGPGVFMATSGTGYNPFVARVNSSGNLVWCNALFDVVFQTSSSEAFRKVVVGPPGTNRIYTSGITGHYVDLDPSPINSCTAPISGNHTIACYDYTGGLLWCAFTSGYHNIIPFAMDLAVDYNDQVFFAGNYENDTLHFGPYSLLNSQQGFAGDTRDIFLSHLGHSGFVSLFDKDLISPTLFPNPFDQSFLINLPENNNTCIIDVYNSTGQLILSARNAGQKNYEIETIDWPSGIYFVRMIIDNELTVSKMVKTSMK